MTQVKMPEPTEQANLAEYIMGKRYFTSAQMKAYAAAKVLEALEAAAKIVDDEAGNARQEHCHPKLVGTLANLPKHTQETILAYGAACARTALQSSEAQGLKRDAERYRLLRDRENSLETRQYDKGIYNGPSCYHNVEGIRELKWGTELDAAIDAAMEQKP